MVYNDSTEFYKKIKNDREVAAFLLGAQLDYKENKQDESVYLKKMCALLKKKEIDNKPDKITKRPFGYVFNFGKKVKLQLQNVRGNIYKIVIK